MAGWSKEKRRVFEDAFYKFLSSCLINSKDAGAISLGDNLYDGQIRFINTVLDSLENDIHKIYVLKSRQLGLTTISRALSMFYIGIHKGLKGALVFDTAPNRDESRAELATMIADLPAKLKFPTVKDNNREGLTLFNSSKILFKSAGVKKTKSSGTLGRSVGITMAHLSEVCSYDNDEGLESFEQSLSDLHPDRLYIYESTARGYNRWYDMWQEARDDPTHCACLFLGWWSKPTQMIARSHVDFDLYGSHPPTEKEQQKIGVVRERYGHQITPEQLAWIRRKMDPSARAEDGVQPEYEGSNTRVQEQPWVEEDSFQQTGSVFFSAENLTELTNKHASHPHSTYTFQPGLEFMDMRVIKPPTAKMIDLRVWEEPDRDGVYVLGVDPAFGGNEHNDRSSIQVLRCYADGADQVAEYASPFVTAQQLAWVVASLLGWYGKEKAEVRYILELNGPGSAVFYELKSLKRQFESGYIPNVEESGLKDIFRNVRSYIYSRVDSFAIGHNYHFKTTTNTKVMLMNRLRDFISNGSLHVRSMDAIDEMKKVEQDGDTIAAPGAMKDDRVVALGLATHCWESMVRPNLISGRRTRLAEEAKKRLSITDQVYLFQQNQLSAFFDQKKRVRSQEQMLAARARWRYR